MKKMFKDIKGFGAASIGLGVSSAIVAKTGQPVGQGLTAAADMMPIVGTTMMAGHAMRMVRHRKMKRR